MLRKTRVVNCVNAGFETGSSRCINPLSQCAASTRRENVHGPHTGNHHGSIAAGVCPGCSLDGRRDLLRRVWRSQVGPLGRAGLGRWRDCDVRGLAAALAADRCLARGGVAIPRLVVPTETEPRPRLGPERRRAAAGCHRRGCGDDRKRPQPRIPFARRFHSAVGRPHVSSLESQGSGRHFLRLGRWA